MTRVQIFSLNKNVPVSLTIHYVLENKSGRTHGTGFKHSVYQTWPLQKLDKSFQNKLITFPSEYPGLGTSVSKKK